MKKKSAAKRVEQHHPPQPEPCPWLVYFTDKYCKRQIFCSISNPNETYIRRIPELRNRCIWASCHGWCLCFGRDFSHVLWSPVTMEEIKLPCMPKVDILDCILTSSPSEPGCKVILFVAIMPYILYCEPGDEEWTHLCYYDELKRSSEEVGQIMDHKEPNLLVHPVCCNGNLYAVWTPSGLKRDAKQLVKFHDIRPDSVKIEFLNVVLPSFLSPSKALHLMESCGDLFTIQIQFKGEYETGVLAIEIHRLNFSKKEWGKVETAEDRAFFWPNYPDDRAISIPAINPDIASRVYFTLNGDHTSNKLYSYNIEDGTISVSTPFLNLPRVVKFCPTWVMPHLR
ncbi:hypothetical protein ACB092_06G052100 [Castanea dentata]